MGEKSSPPIRPFRWADLEADSAGAEGPQAARGDGVRRFEPQAFEDRADEPRGSEESADPGAPADGAAPPDPLARAREEAEQILLRAREEAGRIRAAAREEGIRQGREEARAEAAERAEALEALLRELAGWKPRLYEEARAQVLELVLELVRKMLGPLSEQCEGTVVHVVGRALQALADREQVTVRVHPTDLEEVVEAKPTLLEAVDGIRQLTVVEDPSVGRGGCRVQTPTAEIDARLDTQLEELVRVLRGA